MINWMSTGFDNEIGPTTLFLSFCVSGMGGVDIEDLDYLSFFFPVVKPRPSSVYEMWGLFIAGQECSPSEVGYMILRSWDEVVVFILRDLWDLNLFQLY